MSVINNSINNSCLVTTFTSSGTWTINPRTKAFSFFGWDGGGGGGSGYRGLTTASSGGGGGSVGYLTEIIMPAFVLSASSYSITIGAGGLGGAAQTTNNTVGNDGATGGATIFNVWYTGRVNGSMGGQGGQLTSATGGVYALYGMQSTQLSSLANGGNGNNVEGSAPNGLSGAWTFAGAPAGGGAGADSTTARQGGSGNPIQANDRGTVLVAASVGGIETGTINGQVGTNGSATAPGPSGKLAGGTGGGGGGGQKSGGAAGNGGNGGAIGGAGGGGGGSLNGTNSGKGGDGGKGALIIIEYF